MKLKMKSNNFIIYIPNNIKIFIWKNKNSNSYNLVLLENLKKYNIIFKYESIKIDKWCNSIQIINNNLDKNIKKINNIINNFLFSWNIFYFDKIKFKGKGFRIKFFKKIKLIKFYFGKSHKTFMFLKKIKRKKLNKYKFIIKSINFDKIQNVSNNIKKIRTINVYTLRGLRSSRQIIFKRKGKKGTYI